MRSFIDYLSKIKYEIIQGNPKEEQVSTIIYDNRNFVEKAIFICMKGTKFDTHTCIKDLYDKGCRAFVIEREVPLEGLKGATIIKVDNARKALALLSIEEFDNPASKLTVIGITGTKGKTSTSFMIQKMLLNAGIKTGVIGTMGVWYNDKYIDSGNTTPESYLLQKYLRLMLDDGITHVVMECSSQGFMMHRVDGIIYDYGIFTNITPDHIGENEHKDFEEYLYYKEKLFDQCKCAFINKDTEHYEEIEQYVKTKNIEYYTYAIDNEADIVAFDIKHILSKELFGIEFSIKGIYIDKFELALPGKFNVYNALAAICICKKLGLEHSVIQESLSSIKINGRMEVVISNDKFKVVVDYAHNPVSMENLLNTLKEYKPKRLIALFGCGGNRAKERRFGMGRIAARLADLSILTADNSRFEETKNIINDIKTTLVPEGGKYIEIDDRREAIKYAIQNAKEGDLIAVIGKGHEDYNEQNGVKTHFLDREEILKAYNNE